MSQFDTSRRSFFKTAALGIGAAALPAAVPAASALPLAPAVQRQAPYRVGRWLPSDQRHLNLWLANLKQEVETNPKPLHPVIAEFQELIESDPEVYMYFHQMFEQLPDTPKFKTDPTGQPQVRDYKTMLRMINQILTTAPVFNKTGLVGFPINAILDWPMGTPGGFAGFLDDKVNRQFKKVLNAWSQFLTSTESAYVLNQDPTSGWLGRDAMEAMPDFVKQFRCDPAKPHYGFTSWDDFFTRRFRPGVRPVAEPDNDKLVVNACESAPYAIARDVKAQAPFWIKGQPYSLRHMFGDDPVYQRFVGGTIYQAFLSALSYHRWHSPVNGTVVATRVIDGSYYSEAPIHGFEAPANAYDPAAPNESQGYITEVATRAYILIEADDPAIGLMAFLAVGMAEVSTCDITVSKGQRLRKGEQTGMFHFGGSTHCLIFRPGVTVEFDLHGQKPGLDSTNIPINSAIARVG